MFISDWEWPTTTLVCSLLIVECNVHLGLTRKPNRRACICRAQPPKVSPPSTMDWSSQGLTIEMLPIVLIFKKRSLRISTVCVFILLLTLYVLDLYEYIKRLASVLVCLHYKKKNCRLSSDYLTAVEYNVVRVTWNRQ